MLTRKKGGKLERGQEYIGASATDGKQDGREWRKPQKTKEEGANYKDCEEAEKWRSVRLAATESEEKWPRSQAVGCARAVKGGWKISTLRSAKQTKQGKIKHKLMIRERRILQRRGKKLIQTLKVCRGEKEEEEKKWRKEHMKFGFIFFLSFTENVITVCKSQFPIFHFQISILQTHFSFA